jgi:hypothetical protein
VGQATERAQTTVITTTVALTVMGMSGSKRSVNFWHPDARRSVRLGDAAVHSLPVWQRTPGRPTCLRSTENGQPHGHLVEGQGACLSVAMSAGLPRVSTAEGCLMIAPHCASLDAPIARVKATTAVRFSGNGGHRKRYGGE